MSNKDPKDWLNNILGTIGVRPIITMFRSLFVLEFKYGHFKTSQQWSAVDNQNRPTPWFTYPAIDYLNNLNLKGVSIFEFGAGNSTLFWKNKGCIVTSVEHNLLWYKKILGTLNKAKKVNLIFEKDLGNYSNVINKGYDIIVIDGPKRYTCAKNSIKYLNGGGMIILDDSAQYANVAKLLRNTGLIQVDFSGFLPIIPQTSVTSFFIHRNFRFVSSHNRWPIFPPGGIRILKRN